MQKPTSEEGAIIKREWWRVWDHDKLPDISYYIIQSLRYCVFKKRNSRLFSAITTWGVFYPNEDAINRLT